MLRFSALRESDGDTAVLAALAFDFRDRHGADLGGVADMRAAARLQIDSAARAGNLDEADPSCTGRRLYRHRAHQFGAGGEFVVSNPARRDGVTSRDQLVEARRDRLAVAAGPGAVGIEPAAPRG